MDFKKNFLSTSKTVIRMFAMASLLQAGCVSASKSESSPASKTFFQKRPYFSLTSLTAEEEEQFSILIKNFTERSLSAKKILDELAAQNACLKLYTKQPDKEGVFQAGYSNETTLNLNRLIKEKGFSIENTFFHEAEHVVHLNRAHKHGINARSFSSLNDVYIYATLLEALAYRKAFICCEEYKGKLSAHEIQKEAQKVFEERFLTKSKNEKVRRSYEDDAIIMANSDANPLPNQVHFGKNPDWNKIVSILSREEVTSVSVLPQPTLTFFALCLLREIEKHPNADSLQDLDISCVLKNKSAFQKDQKAIKEIISAHLMEVYDTLVESKKNISQETRSSFLYLIGWPTAQQQAEIDRQETMPQKKAVFKRVYESNLQSFEVSSMFDAAIKLLGRKELTDCHLPEVKKFEKILKFEKLALVPSTSAPKTLGKQKIR